MPRIFKGSESTLRLLISKTGDYQALTEIKIKLYTTNIENAIEIIDGIQVCKNIAIITLAPRAFMGMEDGLINYIIDGATEDDVFHTERQSNYMLKSLSYINEDGVATQTMTIESNGEYRVTPNDGLYVDINVNVPDLNGSYDDGFNVGYGQGKTDGANEQKSKLESINITENGTYIKEDGYNHIEVNVPDLNGSYDEGYAEGERVGYNQGKTDGINEQKLKLETINITQNGTYTKEDGYNHIEVNVPDLNGSYDEGYNQGQADIAAKARVLNVTENGNYLSKFSDPIVPELVTGVYGDGTDFYSYALISNIIYSTGIIPNQNTRLEFWFKPYGDEYEDWEIIIGSQRADDTTDTFQVRRYATNTNDFVAEIGTSEVRFTMSENKWYHIIMSVADGFVLDGTKIGDFSENMTVSNTPLQIGGSINFNGQRTEEGYYGMIKIDDNIIIPTENGFKNVTTDQLLQTLKDGSYTYTENVPIYGEGELYKTINVNVIPKINVKEARIKFAYGKFEEVPEWADFDGVTDMSYMFGDCYSLQTVPQIDTSNVTNMSNMFYSCRSIRTIPLFDTSNVTNMSYMLTDCSRLETIPEIDTSNVINMIYIFSNCQNLQTIPLLNTSNVTDMSSMFSECYNLQTIPQIDTSNVTYMGNMFYNCSSLVSLPALNVQNLDMPSYSSLFGYYELPKLTDFGGLLNLKSSLTNGGNLKKLPNLTYESCINVLNGLYDFTGNGETPDSNQGQLKVHQNFLDKVGNEISIGTNKGWTISV